MKGDISVRHWRAKPCMACLLDETGIATDVQKCELSLGSIINPINILATGQENFAITGNCSTWLTIRFRLVECSGSGEHNNGQLHTGYS
jgi:hypothetical protein